MIEGWVVSLSFMVVDGNQDSGYLVSGSQDATIKIWNLKDGSCLQTLDQCAGITCMLKSPQHGQHLYLFGDMEGKLSFVDLDNSWKMSEDYEPDSIHILPNILIGTGKYCRSSKYHDKSVDIAHLTDNGYLITASEGSKFVKIWKIKVPSGSGEPDLEGTEIRELQILRDHSDYLSTFCVHSDTIYSSCSDGKIYAHSFPKVDNDSNVHYDMAFDDDTTTASALATLDKQTSMVATKSHEKSTEVCDGPRFCRTGKTGLIRSSSSFQVNILLFFVSIC